MVNWKSIRSTSKDDSLEHPIFDQQVKGSSLSWVPLRSNLGQVTYTYMPWSPSSTIWYWPNGWEINTYHVMH